LPKVPCASTCTRRLAGAQAALHMHKHKVLCTCTSTMFLAQELDALRNHWVLFASTPCFAHAHNALRKRTALREHMVPCTWRLAQTHGSLRKCTECWASATCHVQARSDLYTHSVACASTRCLVQAQALLRKHKLPCLVKTQGACWRCNLLRCRTCSCNGLYVLRMDANAHIHMHICTTARARARAHVHSHSHAHAHVHAQEHAAEVGVHAVVLNMF
jgi:hypothetical protein